jgi:5-(carboxyamino)imidazole ribonucleotide synthase
LTRVGIVGGGQLGRMLALAGYPLDIRCTVLDPAPDACASQVAPSIVGAYDDPVALARLATEGNVVTYEFENVPVETLRSIANRVAIHPPPEALEAAQDRLLEKALFDSVGIECAPYVPVDSTASLGTAIEQVGVPAVIKTRRLGYDGKGQRVIRDPRLAEEAWLSLGGVPSILEGLVLFERELSMVAVRALDGDSGFYPLVENTHRAGILDLTRAPAQEVSTELQRAAEQSASAMMDHLGYVGVLAIEMFQVGERLLGNEIAPRVHNSAHWTIEGAQTSQFENHLRAITGLPLGSTAPIGHSAMVNLIGSAPDASAIAAIPGAHLHLYGKEPRPGRKIGHVTLRAEDPLELELWLPKLRALVDDAGDRGPWLT